MIPETGTGVGNTALVGVVRRWRTTVLVALVVTSTPSTAFANSSSWHADSYTRSVRRAEVEVAPDSVPTAGWFHFTGRSVPAGTVAIRYRNVAVPGQVGEADQAPGPLSLWLRAPGLPGSTMTIQLEAIDARRVVVASLGSITVVTGNALLPLPTNSGFGRRLVIHSDQQQVWLVEADGRVLDTFLMSGRRVRTASGLDQPGLFRAYSKSGTMRYCDGRCGTAKFMVRYQTGFAGAVGLHGIPIEKGRPVQSVADLGWPLSHGCARLEESKAREVFMWANLGTVVVVL